jgi:predicted transcriptional regulator
MEIRIIWSSWKAERGDQTICEICSLFKLIKLEEKIPRANEMLKLTAEIVISHASMSELTSAELVDEINEVFNVLSSLEGGLAPETMAPEKGPEAEAVKKPSVPLKNIVKEKYVVCLECGKKLKTLRTHIRKAHNLMPKEYFKMFGLDPKKYPLVCREYSEQRSKMTKNRGFGERGTHHKATS